VSFQDLGKCVKRILKVEDSLLEKHVGISTLFKVLVQLEVTQEALALVVPTQEILTLA
jgi:hypothetical protein